MATLHQRPDDLLDNRGDGLIDVDDQPVTRFLEDRELTVEQGLRA